MVHTGSICHGCLTEGSQMLLFEIRPGRLVCQECFDKVREFDKAHAEVPSTEKSR